MRKRFIYLGFAAAAMLMGSCQAEKLGQSTSGEVDFTISTSIPAGLTTYADGASAFSHMGGANNVKADEYDLRYTLEVYDGDNMVYEDVEIVKDNFATEGVEFGVRLLAKKYTFVLWADFVEEVQDEASAKDMYYVTSDLREISYNTSDLNALTTDMADAYYASQEVDLTTAGQSLNVKLTRPFGKLRLIATDKLADGVQQSEYPADVIVDFGGAEVPASFNALRGESSGTLTVNSLSFAAVKENASVSGSEKAGYLLGQAYFFATEPASAHAFNVTVNSNADNQIGYRELSAIPVEENKLTTVIGNFYTNEGSLEVIVDDAFDTENVEEVEDLVFPASGAYNNETGESYETLADAIADMQGSEEVVITIAPETFDEVITSSNEMTGRARIVGTEGSRIQGLYVNSGVYEFENVTFYGKGGYSTGSTVYVGNTADVTLNNCDINVEVELGTNGRPVETSSSFKGSFVLDGCTVNTNGKSGFAYLNPAAKDSSIQILNSTFDDVLAAEYYSTGVYPVIEGNTFAKTVDFTPAEGEIKNTSLALASKQYVNGILENNEFKGENKVAAYFSSEATYYNSPIEIGGVINETLGQDYESLGEAVAAAEARNVIVLAEGEYALNCDVPYPDSESQNFYLPIDVEGLTIRGTGDRSKTIIYGEQVEPNGGWGTQNTITVFADNVTIENVTLMPKQAVNKLVEIRGNNFRLVNCIATPNTIVDGANSTNCGSIYFAGESDGGSVEDCTIKYGTVSFDGLMEGDFLVKGNTFVEGNNNLVFTTPNWTSNDVTKSTLMVTVEENTFEGFETFAEGETNPAVRAYYGTFNLINNTFPTTDGIYWNATGTGLILFNGVYPFSGGKGTYENPYQLSTPEDILMIGKLYTAGAYEFIYSAAFEMTDDIDISATPIRNLGIMGFLFDGNGHTLTVNLTSESTTGAGNNVGLFAAFNGKGNEYIYEDANGDYELNGKKYTIKGGCIRDLVIEGTVTSTASGSVAAVVGGSCTGYIINVTNNATINASKGASFVGGIASYVKGTGLILDCTNNGNITVTGGDSARPVGGITAQSYGGSSCNGTYPDILAPYSASVQNCHNTGNIDTDTYDVGGIMGQTHGYGNTKCIKDCSNTGNITGTKNVGGILGRHTSTGGKMLLSGNTNSGTVTATTNTGAGSIYGTNEGTLLEGSQAQN